MIRPDLTAIRSRAHTRWGAKRSTYATVAAAFDVAQLLALVATLDRRLTAMQAERKPPKPARPRMVTTLCECGCGAKVRRRFADGHNLRTAPAAVAAREAAALAAGTGRRAA